MRRKYARWRKPSSGLQVWIRGKEYSNITLGEPANRVTLEVVNAIWRERGGKEAIRRLIGTRFIKRRQRAGSAGRRRPR